MVAAGGEGRRGDVPTADPLGFERCAGGMELTAGVLASNDRIAPTVVP